MQQTTVRQRFAVVVAALVMCVPASAAVSVHIFGEPAQISPAPQVNDGVLLGAPAPIAGKLGCRFMRQDEALLIITPAGKRITIAPGSDVLSVDNVSLQMARKAFVAGDAVICPLVPVLEAIGADIRWVPSKETLALSTRVNSIQVFADNEGARVQVATPLRTEGSLHFMQGPERAYVDLAGATMALEHDRWYVTQGDLLRVRWGQFSTDPPVARVVMDLRGGAKVDWEPDPDGLGGAMILGEVQGDEPLIERRVPKITAINTRTPDADTTLVQAQLSDAVETELDVQADPPRVTLEFPDAAPEMPLAPMEIDGPFVGSLRLAGKAGEPGAKLVLDMKQLIHFDIDHTLDPPAVTLIFKRGKLADKRVVIDPGHGGRDSGARGERLLEKEINLDVGRQVAAKLMQMGVQTILTRDSDEYVGLYERPELANRIGADLFVSIHCNAMPTRNTGHGTETFYYHDRSMCLGAVMHGELMKALRRTDRGLKWANFCVTRESNMPAVLVELMFLNNDTEHALLEKPEVRTAAATAIAEGLRKYVEGTGSTLEEAEMGM